MHKRTGEGDCSLMFSEIVPNKKFTDLQMNKEQFNFIFFFLTSFLPMREGSLEDIGVLAYCLLYMNLDEPSSH